MQKTEQIGILRTIPREKEVRLSRELLETMNDAYSEIFIPTLVFNKDKFNQKIIRSKEILGELL
jgi:hypothetical protein